MTALNAVLNRLFDLLLGPLRGLPLLAVLAILSVVTAIAMLLVVRATSDQPAIAAVKRQIQADLFEIRLFNDDIRAMGRAQLDILRHNATYLRLSLQPMLWMLIPFVLVVAQLQSYFGYAGIEVGQPALITAQWKSAAPTLADAVPLTLEATRGIRVEIPGAWFPALQQAVWRVVPTAPGDYVLRFQIGGQSYDKTLHVSPGIARRSPLRPDAGLLAQWIDPSEAPIPSSAPLASIAVDYPEREVELFGWRMHWLTVYLVLSVFFAFVLKRPLRVSI